MPRPKRMLWGRWGRSHRPQRASSHVSGNQSVSCLFPCGSMWAGLAQGVPGLWVWLTEDAEMLQALQVCIFQFQLLFPGQLLGDHASIAQASPQPRDGRSHTETDTLVPSAPLLGCVLLFPTVFHRPPGLPPAEGLAAHCNCV